MTAQPQQFASDNYAGACPEAMQAMLAANAGSAVAYGDDDWTQAAADRLATIQAFVGRAPAVTATAAGATTAAAPATPAAASAVPLAAPAPARTSLVRRLAASSPAARTAARPATM